MKEGLFMTITGAIGGYISYLFGGWNSAPETLLIFIAIDFITGLFVAGIFKKSEKTKSGALSSKAGWIGLLYL